MTNEQVGPDMEQIEGETEGEKFIFEAVSDPEWNESHFTFRSENGCTWRVPRKELVMVGHPEPEGTGKAPRPRQPRHGRGVVFNLRAWYYRHEDGWWYKVGQAFTKRNRRSWESLWEEFGTEHVSEIMAVPDITIPVMVPKQGPTEQGFLPDMSTGVPQPGLNISMQGDSLLVHHAQLGVSVEYDPEQVNFLFGIYFRTLSERVQSDDDSGDAVQS